METEAQRRLARPPHLPGDGRAGFKPRPVWISPCAQLVPQTTQKHCLQGVHAPQLALSQLEKTHLPKSFVMVTGCLTQGRRDPSSACLLPWAFPAGLGSPLISSPQLPHIYPCGQEPVGGAGGSDFISHVCQGHGSL